ncbi:MAG: hypothetical protein ACPLW6_02940 [Desulfurella sp.]|uniref:Uncharacterized protein n=1 Tax=Desulfurella multipotens TaxID=79269 RepID=A0A1G6NB43_9BACT|nr:MULTISPECIES: hypothetical protein [Desulfurella]PMP67436.1 MAG: hypothetical protein C0192_03430 [Desulfurella multipotens]PMP90106.1 MAG: hypothetical protein C0173_04850 [Desulfurella sp.]SDC64637.1 hypothetical protein SAMN05660835_01152 [Desulfurella multipotens]HEX13549.1 hypothetical protein [Desulfurella acetivorans]
MFNFSVENIIVETVVYILVSLIVKILLNDEDLTSIRRILLIGYLVFASLFVSLIVFAIVSVSVVLIAIGIRKVFEY